MADDPEKPQRTTSFAKTLDPAAVERVRKLRTHFDRAKAATEKSPERKTRESRESSQPERATSFAKTLDPGAIARVEKLRRHFKRADTAPEPTREERNVTPRSARHDPVAQKLLHSNLPGAKEVDRKAFEARQAQLAKAEEIKRQIERENARRLSDDRNQDRDHRGR